MNEIWYRLNTMGEKTLFEQNNLFDGIIIPAHLLAFYDPSLISFIEDVNKSFIIDPMTYVWEQPLENIKSGNILKKSYTKYIEKLECRIGEILPDSRISIHDCTDSEITIFVDKILRFQAEIKSINKKNVDRKKSLDRIRRKMSKKVDSEIRAEYLVPPYFYFTHTNDSNYHLSIQCKKLAVNNKSYSNFEIIPCICMAKEILYDRGQINRIIEDYSEHRHVLLWLDEFDDRTASNYELRLLKELIQRFTEKNVSIINMYGSFYSVLLGYYGLDFFSSGIALSHRKGVNSVAGGGGLPLRYYEPTFKQEIVNEDVFTLYSHYPELFVCDCPVCNQISARIRQTQTIEEREIILDEFFIEIRRRNAEGKNELIRPAIMDWTNSRLHFMHVRKAELDLENRLTSEQMKQLLRNDYNMLNQKVNYILFSRITEPNHLSRWSSQL